MRVTGWRWVLRCCCHLVVKGRSKKAKQQLQNSCLDGQRPLLRTWCTYICFYNDLAWQFQYSHIVNANKMSFETFLQLRWQKCKNERKVEMTGHLRTGYFSLESVTALTFVAVTSVGFPMCSPVFVSFLKYFLTTEKTLWNFWTARSPEDSGDQKQL